MKKKKKKKQPFIPLKFIVVIFVGIIFSTIAYASTTYNLEADGELSLDGQNGVIITNVTSSSVSENSSFKINHYVNTMLNNTINLDNENSEIVLAVEVKNASNNKYRFEGILYDSTGNAGLGAYSNPDIVPEVTTGTNGISTGTIIDANETKLVYVKYKFVGDEFTGTNPGLLNGTIKINFVRLYSISYELNGGTQAENQPIYYAENDTITLLEPTKDRSDFIGWYENNSHTGNAVTTISGRTGDITLYAYFHTYHDVYFLVPPSWYKEDYEDEYTVKMFIFKESDKSYYAEWPGLTMTKVDSYNYYKATLTDDILENYDKVVFSNGKIPGSNTDYTYFDIDKKYSQTVDIDFTSYNWDGLFVPEVYGAENNTSNIRFFARTNQNLHYYLFNQASQVAQDPWPGLEFSINRGASVSQVVFNKTKYDRLIINKGNGQAQTPDLVVPTYGDLTFSSTTEGNNGVFYFYVTRQFYDGAWRDYASFKYSAGYEEWHNKHYPVFEDTWNQVNTLNSILH